MSASSSDSRESRRRIAAPAWRVLLALPAALALCSTAGGQPARQASGSPVVRSMIVGAGGAILSPARAVSASASTVRVGGRSCSVAAGTPLAVLAAVRRSGGPGFALRDYGRCGRSPRNSGQLFVSSLAGERNRGESGWEYKVEGRSGSTGAADPSGAQGDGRRLRPGARVLWFWCDARPGGCQRTLSVSSSAGVVSAGGPVTVTVLGYDNEGRGVPVSGASVSFGPSAAVTAAGGRVTVSAPPAPGRYPLAASRTGLVTSFPETIVVR